MTDERLDKGTVTLAALSAGFAMLSLAILLFQVERYLSGATSWDFFVRKVMQSAPAALIWGALAMALLRRSKRALAPALGLLGLAAANIVGVTSFVRSLPENSLAGLAVLLTLALVGLKLVFVARVLHGFRQGHLT